MYYERVKCFDRVKLTGVRAGRRRIEGTVVVETGDQTDSFRLIFSYDQDISPTVNVANLILTMPLINFAYFTDTIELDFPVTELDLSLLAHFVRINNREVFVNKICRRRYEFFRREYLPEDDEITEANALGGTKIATSGTVPEDYVQLPDMNRSAVLSSGGKESLVTYGIMNDLGSEVYPFFFNESGRHWLPAKPAYDRFSSEFQNTMKVWSNVDRFYKFMLRKMKILDLAAVNRKTDTYPVRLFIFPVYIFSLLPLAMKHRIGNILIGDEFDDPHEMPPYRGIKHYFGIYDQSQDFNDHMSQYFTAKGYRIKLWSAVYPVSGSVVERILIERYPDLFRLQRSCHSSRSAGGRIIPCGVCTKCLGVILFILAARGNPEEIGYSRDDSELVAERPDFAKIRLDHDELTTVLRKSGRGDGEIIEHVDGIHLLPWEDGELSRVPAGFRQDLMKLLEKYTSGTYKSNGRGWLRVH